MTILVFGNPDINIDALPLRILPDLRARISNSEFRVMDPNEEFDIPNDTVIIDTVANVTEPKLFTSLAAFEAPPRLSLHDFDLYSHLAFLEKVGRLPKRITIVGLPPTMVPSDAVAFVLDTLPRSSKNVPESLLSPRTR